MGVAQLVERRVVVADVAGSSPVTHPKDQAPGLIPWVFVVVGFTDVRDLGDGRRWRPSVPVTHPRFSAKDRSSGRSFALIMSGLLQAAPLAQLAEQLALNQRVRGSSP